MLLVDTCVLLDVLEDDPAWADWSVKQMRAQAKLHRLVINPIIYAELSLAFSSYEALDDAIQGMDLDVHEVRRPALFVAGKAFIKYRRRGGTKTQVLPDFFIGAQAAVNGWGLLTRDAARFKTYFPSLRVIAP